MKRIVFIKQEGCEDRQHFFGDFSWAELNNTCQPNSPDERFSLHDVINGDYENARSHTLLIDIDHFPKELWREALSHVREVFANCMMYVVFTGNGLHFYCPLKQSFSKLDVARYKKSWLEKVRQLKNKIVLLHPEGVVDKGVFNHVTFGRIPNSVNTKWNVPVEFLIQTFGEQLDSLDSVLSAASVTEIQKPPPRVDAAAQEGKLSPIYTNCAFIRYCEKFATTLPHERWKNAMCALACAGERDLAHEISQTHPSYKPDAVDKFFESEYTISCSKIDDSFEGEQINPCVNCSHRDTGSFPGYISGELPTPSRVHNFYGVKKKGEIFVVDKKKVDVNDAANHFINKVKEDVISVGNSLFKWTGTHYKLYLEYDPKGVYMKFVEFIRDFKEIFSEQRKHSTFTKTFASFIFQKAEFDSVEPENTEPENQINMGNGVLDLDALEFRDHSRSDYFFGCLEDAIFDETATCPKWEQFLQETIKYPDLIKLLQVYMGLIISNTPNSRHQTFLWLYGASGSGKSTIIKVIEGLCTGRAITFMANEVPVGKRGILTDIRGKSLLLCDDFKWTEVKNLKQWDAFITTYTSVKTIPLHVLHKESPHIAPKATLVIGSNEAFKTSNFDSGSLRRLREIPVFYKPKKVIENLEGILLSEEFSGILNWALEGLAYYYKYGLPPRSQAEHDSIFSEDPEEDDGVRAFLVRYCILEPDIKVETEAGKLYMKYTTTTDVGDELSQRRFGTRLKEVVPHVFGLRPGTFKKRRSKGMYYIGFRLKTPEELNEI